MRVLWQAYTQFIQNYSAKNSLQIKPSPLSLSPPRLISFCIPVRRSLKKYSNFDDIDTAAGWGDKEYGDVSVAVNGEKNRARERSPQSALAQTKSELARFLRGKYHCTAG